LSIIQVDTLQKRDGSTFPLGKIGQVLQSTTSTNITTTGGAFVSSNLAVTITPTATSSKIYLIANGIGQIDTNSLCLDIFRSTTSSFISGGLSKRNGCY